MNGRKLLIGISGGVAAYKTAALVSQLVQQQVHVQAILTSAGQRFLGPATLAALTGRPVAIDLFDSAYPLGAHIELAQWADLLCVAPATADVIAKAASGHADDLLSTVYLCFEGPVVMAPAMNTQMWEKPALQRNIDQLRSDGVHIVEPDAGWLSCRQEGRGRMAEPDRIQQVIETVLA